MGSDYPTPIVLQPGRAWGSRVALQHVGAHLAGGDLPQRDHGRLVAVGLDQWARPGAELARAVSRRQRELEAVGNSLQAVVDGDAGHGISSGSGALALDDLAELAPCGFEVFVNYSVFKLAGMRQLLARIVEAAADHRVGVLAARAHAPLELFDRG